MKGRKQISELVDQIEDICRKGGLYSNIDIYISKNDSSQSFKVKTEESPYK